MDDLNWRKSRRSNDHGGACVELAPFPAGIGVRDSKDPDGPKLVLAPAAFHTLLTELKKQ